MNTMLVYIGAICLSLFLVLFIDVLIARISLEKDDESLWMLIAIMNGLLASYLIATLLISRV